MKPAAGFTLVEMLAVLAVIGLVAGLSMVGFNALRGPSLDLEAERVVAALRLARAEAIGTGRTVAVGFVPGEAVTIPALGWEQPLAARALATTGDALARPVAFDGEGRPDRAGLRLVRDGAVRHIRMDILTGRVHVAG